MKPILIDGLRKAILHCDQNDLRRADLRNVDSLLDDRLNIISQSVDEDMEMDIDKFLELARAAVNVMVLK